MAPAQRQPQRWQWEESLRVGLLVLFFATWNLPIAFQQTALGCLLAFLGYTLWQTRALPRIPLQRPFLFFLGALLVSTVLSPDPLQSLLAYRKLWLMGGCLAVFVLVRDRREVEKVLTVALWVAGVVAAYSIVQHFSGLDLAKTLVGKESNLDPFWFGRQEGYRVKGLHPSGITYAHALLFPLGLITAWGLSPRLPKAQRLLLGVGWALMLFALFFSLTRGVWVAYGVLLLMCGLVRGRRVWLAVVGGVAVCGLIFVSAGPGVRERGLSILDFQANTGRSQIWLANMDMIKERPLTGWGFGNYRQFREAFYQRYPDADTDAHAHNNFLQVWVDAGLIGLVAFLFLVGSIIVMGWRAYARQRAEPLKSLTLGCWLGLVGFLIGGLTQYNWGDAEVALVWWALVGLMMRVSNFVEETEKRALSETAAPIS